MKTSNHLLRRLTAALLAAVLALSIALPVFVIGIDVGYPWENVAEIK